jgi:uncharacterized protein YbjT (DUF2867 family)
MPVLIVLLLLPGKEFRMEAPGRRANCSNSIAIFGATGTAGDGILKAVLGDADFATVYVVTRRSSARIESGVATGHVKLITHTDYLDYSPLTDLLRQIDTIYWALGTSAGNVSDDLYGSIHVDFPLALARDWLAARPDDELSLHFLSGMGASASSRMHWAREKARAENGLFALAEGTNLRAISYRPSYIAPVRESARLAQNVAHALFAPLKLALRSTALGYAVLEISVAGKEIPHGTILENRDVLKYADNYRRRRGQTATD